MLWGLWFGLACAQDIDRSEHVEMSVASVDNGVLRGTTGWLRTAEGCHQASMGAEITVPMCEGAVNGKPASCTAELPLEVQWTGWWSGHCEFADGTGWGMGQGSSAHGFPVLVRHDADVAIWRHMYALIAAPIVQLREVSTCLSGDGSRTCDTSTGLQIYPVRTAGAGIGVGTAQLPDPVDCSEPCATNVDLLAVREANRRLEGRTFSQPGLANAAVYRTQAGCERAPATTVRLPEQLCIDPATAAESVK